MSDQLPELRASDSDRERTAEVLRHAASDGQLTVDELEERVSAAYAARTRRELEQLTADVVPATPAPVGHRSGIAVKRRAWRGRKLSRREERELREAKRQQIEP